MATPNKYFTYERRDIDRSTINWAGIGNEISTNIKEIEDKREAQRKEIEKNHLDAISKMNTYEQGLNKGVNEFMARQANNSKQYIHEQYKMMKSGIVDPSEYNVAKIKLSDTYKVLNDTVKTFNEKYQTAIEEGSEGSLFLAEEATTLFDFKNRELYINPETHEAYLARVNADGEMDENSIKPVRALANNQNFIWEGFNPEEEISDKLDGLGVWKRQYSNKAIRSSIKRNPAYKKWKESTIGSFMGQDRKAGSILTEGVGGYSYTRDKEEAKSDPTKILMKDNADGIPMPELTDEQKEEAEEYLGNQIEARIGFTKIDAPQEEESETGGGDGDTKTSLRATYNTNLTPSRVQGDEDWTLEDSGDSFTLQTQEGEFPTGIIQDKPNAEITTIVKVGNNYFARTRDTSKTTVRTKKGEPTAEKGEGTSTVDTTVTETPDVKLKSNELNILARRLGFNNSSELDKYFTSLTPKGTNNDNLSLAERMKQNIQ